MVQSKEFLHQRFRLLVTLLWVIWKARNEFIFMHKMNWPSVALNKANVLLAEFLAACLNADHKPASSGQITIATRWRPPPLEKLKCNVDAVFLENRKLGAISAIICDCYGRVITGKALRIHTLSSLAAEAWAVCDGLILARSCFCKEILIWLPANHWSM